MGNVQKAIPPQCETNLFYLRFEYANFVEYIFDRKRFELFKKEYNRSLRYLP